MCIYIVDLYGGYHPSPVTPGGQSLYPLHNLLHTKNPNNFVQFLVQET